MIVTPPRIWAITSEYDAVSALEQREARERAILESPEQVAALLYEWLPGSIAKHGDVTCMSCRSPLMQSDYVRMITNLDALEKDD